ncbi:MAG: hypothetical protein ACTSR8_00345 [Promethearchaeota archaeon]
MNDSEKQSIITPFVWIEIGLFVFSGFFLIYGNIMAIGGIEQADPMAMTILTLGFAFSAFYFFIAFIVTWFNRGEQKVGDITLANVGANTLFVANIFTIGSFLDDLPLTQSVFLDAGLIVGSFHIFACGYLWLKERTDFLEIEDIDFIAGTDKEKYPQFFLATILLGAVYAGIFIIFKIIYLIIGYNWTCYIFLGVIFIYGFLLAFLQDIIEKITK